MNINMHQKGRNYRYTQLKKPLVDQCNFKEIIHRTQAKKDRCYASLIIVSRAPFEVSLVELDQLNQGLASSPNKTRTLLTG